MPGLPRAERVRPEFVARMEAEMRANSHKNAPGTFADWAPTLEELVREMELHSEKLHKALREGRRDKVAEHAADCALNCMKAHQLFGS